MPAARISATGVAKSNTDQGQRLAQEVDTQNASNGGGHHRPRLVDGGVLAVPSAALAARGDGGVGRHQQENERQSTQFDGVGRV